VSDAATWILAALAAGVLGGAGAGAWLARRNDLRWVGELEAYLRGWEDGERVDAERGPGTDPPAQPVPFRARRLRPLYAQLEARRLAYRDLQGSSILTARRFQTLMDVLKDGVLLYDAEGRLLFVNGPLRELAGVAEPLAQDGAAAEVVRNVSDLLEARSDVPAFVREALQAAAELDPREVEIRAGERERRFMATPYLIRPREDPARQGVLLLLTDVAVLEAVRAGARSEVALDHVQLSAELMAHRVRNPLNSIVLVLELMRRRPGAPAEPDKNLGTIRGEVLRLESQLQRFLNMVRRRARRPEAVDLVSVLEGVCELLYAPARDARVTLRQHLQVPAARVRGDEVELTRALLGPCAELLRASSPGAEVKIRLDSDGREHLLLLECAGVPPGRIPLAVAAELVAANGGVLTVDDPRHPTRLTYRFRAAAGAETAAS
jgi:signal transduction histidine kinase